MTRSHDHDSFVGGGGGKGKGKRATIFLLMRNPMHSAARDELQSFKLPKRNRQLESGCSKEAKTVADSFYPTLFHQYTRFNTYDIVMANH